MAIFGTVETLGKQACSKKYGKVIEFLQTEDLAKHFAEVTPDKKKTVEIDGKNLFAIFQEYDTKFYTDAKLEGHRAYADVQYIYEGSETIGYCDIADVQGDIDNNAEKDIFFCKSNSLSQVVLSAGQGAVLEPSDLHAPCMRVGGKPAHVKKIVFKVKL